jgi:hypothetical protein
VAELAAYPNPASGQLRLAHPAALASARIVVYNSLGQQVAALTPATGQQETTISLAGLPGGCYLATFTDGQSRGSCRFVRE